MRVGTRSVFMCDRLGRKTLSCRRAVAVMGICRRTTGQAVVTTMRWSARLIRRPRHCSSNRCNSENQRRSGRFKSPHPAPRDHDVQQIRIATDPWHFGQTFDPRVLRQLHLASRVANLTNAAVQNAIDAHGSRPAARPVKLRRGAPGRRLAEHGVNQSARPSAETIATDPALAGAAPFVR